MAARSTPMAPGTPTEIGDRRAIVTGGSTGIGFAVARALASLGMDVTIASRDEARGAAAVAAIAAAEPRATIRFARLDLDSLADIRRFAAAEFSGGRALDLLVNNAGVMLLPQREVTADGFERQFATNHLGPFLLTALLWPALAASTGARVVTVASLAHWRGRIDFADLSATRGYRPYAAYAQSKLANLLFAFELARRVRVSGPLSVAAHPGIAKTPLVRSGLGGEGGVRARLLVAWYDAIGQDASAGALPILQAATGPAQPGQYFGPRGPFGFRGPVGLVRASRAARDTEAAARLWAASEAMAGVQFAPERPIGRSET